MQVTTLLLLAAAALNTFAAPAPLPASEPDCFYLLLDDSSSSSSTSQKPISPDVEAPAAPAAEKPGHKPTIHKSPVGGSAAAAAAPAAAQSSEAAVKKPTIHTSPPASEKPTIHTSGGSKDQKPTIHSATTTAASKPATAAAVDTSGDSKLPEGFRIQSKIGTKPTSPGGKILKQRYGPWTVPAGDKLGEYTDVKVPCPDSDHCFITAMESDLEYEDGSPANIDTGAWLHHMVIVLYGPNREDLVCGKHPFGSLQPIFASGNERVTARLDNDVPAGIRINKGDTLALSTELMNVGSKDKVVYLTTTFEYTEDPSYTTAQLIWLDAAGCFGSDVPAQLGVYDLHTQRWKASINGRFLTGGGHVHDGGERVTVFKNDEEICVSDQLYGRTAAYREPDYDLRRRDGGHHHGGADEMKSTVKMQHISDSGRCDDFGTFKVGDIIEAVSYYNATRYPQMMHGGELHPVMGIANIYVSEI